MTKNESVNYINYINYITSELDKSDTETSNKSDSLINIIKNRTIIYNNIVPIESNIQF